MARAPWWTKVSSDFYRNPRVDERGQTPLKAGTNRRARRMAATLAGTRFADAPEIAQAFLNADVPYSVAQRAGTEYNTIKRVGAANLTQQAGVPEATTAEQVQAQNDPNRPMSEATRQRERDQAVYAMWTGSVPIIPMNQRPDAKPGEELTRFERLQTPSGKAEFDLSARKAFSNTMEVINYLFSPIAVPIAAARANNRTRDEWDEGALGAYQEGVEQATAVGGIPGMLATAQSVGMNFLGGLDFLTGFEDLSPTQQEAMKRQGYDPDSFTSKYAWYFNSVNPGQRAVADSDLAYFKQEFDPTEVLKVHEILNSDYLNDGNRNGLTNASKEFLDRYQARDPEATELFDRMLHSSTLYAGSVVADAMGMPRGEASAMWTSAIADLVIYSALDPIAGIGRGVNAYRYAMRGVPAGRVGAGLQERIVATANPGNPDSLPATRYGQMWDRWLAGIDRIARDIDEADQIAATGAGNPATAADYLNRSALMAERFRQVHPEAAPHYQLLLGMRSGNVQRVTLRTEAEAIAAREAGEAWSPYNIEYTQNYATAARQSNTPAWELQLGPDGYPTQASLNAARAAVVDRMSEFIWGEALMSGRPIWRGQILLPGEIAVNRAVRSAIQPVRDFLMRPGGRLRNVLDPNAGVVQFNGTFDSVAEQLIQTSAGTWVRANYTDSWAPTFEKILRRFEMSPSGKTVSWQGPDSYESYRRLVLQFFPRRMAYVMSNKWAAAHPAERVAQWRQTWEAIATSAGWRNTPEIREFIDQMTSGIRPNPAGANRLNGGTPVQVYTGIRADSDIVADGQTVAAALWPYQLRPGATIPNFRWLRQQQQKNGLLSMITGGFNSKVVSVPVQAWKVGKVGNPANMTRQAGELGWLSVGEQGLGFARDLIAGRRYVAAQVTAGRVARNDLQRASDALRRNPNAGNDDRVLQAAFNSGNLQAYAAELDNVAATLGLNQAQRTALADLANEGVWYQNLADLNDMDRARLMLISSWVDGIRRVRMNTQNANPRVTPDWHAQMDQQLLDDLQRAMTEELGGSAAGYAMLGGYSAADDITALAERGIAGQIARVPNARDLIGVAGDTGARQWHREFVARRSDAVGEYIMRAMAIEERAIPGQSPARLIDAQRAVTNLPPLFPTTVNSADEIAEFLVMQSTLGSNYREQAMRLFYNDDAVGSLATGQAAKDAAMLRAVEAMKRDAAWHMGAESNNGQLVLANGRYVFPQEMRPVIDTLAQDGQVTVAQLAQVPDNVRPAAVSASLYMPKVNPRGRIADQIVHLAAREYAYTVARPLARLAINPAFIANKNVAYRSMEGAFTELQARGISQSQASFFLEYAANKYATNATFRYTDNAWERSVFSELTENFLMFQRAAEDFTRRFFKVTSANPAILSKMYLMMEAGLHTGTIYPNTETDDDGTSETHLVFAFPGSALTSRAFAEVGQTLGWGNDLIQTPLYSGMSSQVRFVNASINNPAGWSLSPMIGVPLRATRDHLFPELYTPINDWLAFTEGGGERHFAEQSWWQSILPGPINRISFAGDLNSNLASSIRNASMYYQAAGLLPDPDTASPDEVERANEAIMQMATNQMIWRAMVGAFSPMAPRYDEPEGIGIPDQTAMNMAMGLSNIRTEYYAVLRAASEKYGSGTPEMWSAANIEWLTRYPYGESIINPDAFKVGTTHPPGTASEAWAGSGLQLTEWMVKERDWVRQNQAVAYYLLPVFNEPDFSPTGVRQQLRLGFRERKDYEEFFNDLRFQIGSREFWDRIQQRDREIAGGSPESEAHARFDDWKRRWEGSHPWTAEEMRRRNNPAYVHNEVAPALRDLLERGNVPAGIDVDAAQRVWDHYSDYRARYNEIDPKTDQYARSRINKEYRDDGDRMFLGTPSQVLWQAMDIYEVD